MLGRKKLAMLVAEFLGTGLLTLVVLSVQRSQLGLAYFVAIAAGITIVALTYIFSSVSGAHFNPALTFALMTARRIKAIPGLMYIVAQLLGAWAAYGLYRYFVNTDVQAVNQAFNGRILLAEAIGTMVFAMAWAAAAYNRFEVSRFATVTGLGFIIALIIASAASVGLANPALAVGARAWEVMGYNGWSNYFVGPILGAVLGVHLYGLLFANPDSPFSSLFGRRTTARKTAKSAAASNEADDEDVEDNDLSADEEVEVIDVDKTINKNAKLGTAAAEPVTKVVKAKRTTAKKTTAKKKR